MGYVHMQLYMTLVSVTLFVIPAILIAACYIIIVCTIWNKGRDIKTSRAPVMDQPLARQPSEVNDDESRRASSRGLIPKGTGVILRLQGVELGGGPWECERPFIPVAFFVWPI